jgi:hypothetical protein
VLRALLITQMDTLNKYIVEMILRKLDKWDDLRAAALTCTTFAKIVSENELFKGRFCPHGIVKHRGVRDIDLCGNEAWGRDALIIKGSSKFTRSSYSLTLSFRDGCDVVVTFKGILAFQMVELDSWDRPIDASCFYEVLDSSWVRSLGGKVDVRRHHHYTLQTYDDVFDVVCERVKCHSAPKEEDDGFSLSKSTAHALDIADELYDWY